MLGEKSRIGEEVRIIPWWAYLIAASVFVGIQVVFDWVGFRHEPHPPPLAVKIFVGLLLGSVLAFLMLLLGYVNRDAKRRRMNATLWTIGVLLIPNALGYILYFLLRKPLAAKCPKCGTVVNRDLNFCPKCRFALQPACPECHRAVRVGDLYCPYCAHELNAVS